MPDPFFFFYTCLLVCGEEKQLEHFLEGVQPMDALVAPGTYGNHAQS